jgi:hypothetical protein
VFFCFFYFGDGGRDDLVQVAAHHANLILHGLDPEMIERRVY